MTRYTVTVLEMVQYDVEAEDETEARERFDMGDAEPQSAHLAEDVVVSVDKARA